MSTKGNMNSEKAQQLAKRKKIIEYYETTANRSKQKTKTRFKSTCHPQTIYKIIKNHEERKNNPDYKAPPELARFTSEDVKKYEELYKIDPLITDAEACHLLNVRLSCLYKIKKAFKEKLNEEQELEQSKEDEVDQDQFNQAVAKIPPVKGRPKAKIRSCLSCFEPVEVEAEASTETTSVLRKNLNAIFVFKTILDISPEEMTRIMRFSRGKDPKDWVAFCGKCSASDLVNEAFVIQSQIKNLEKRLRECKGKVIESIQYAFSVEGEFDEKERHGWALTTRVREIVGEQNDGVFTQVNPFTEGDREAESKLAEWQELERRRQSEPQEVLSRFEEEQDLHLEAPVKVEAPDMVDDTVDNFFSDLATSGSLDVNDDVGGNATEEGDEPASKSELSPDGEAMETYSDVPSVPAASATQGICDVCGVQMRPFAIPTHKLSEHGIVMEGYTLKACKEEGCNYKTLYDIYLKNHRKNCHAPKLAHICGYCGKGFVNKCKLTRHEEIHKNAETRPYQCEICGNSFAVKSCLDWHKRSIHEGKHYPSTLKRMKRKQEKLN